MSRVWLNSHVYKNLSNTYSVVIDPAVNNGVTTDSAGNIYICGYYFNSANIYNQFGVSTGTLPTATSVSAFASKFNSSGVHQYSVVISETSNISISYSITCDSLNNMYFGGQYSGSPTIKTVSSSNVVTNVGTLPPATDFFGTLTENGFVCKFNSSGVYQYSRIIDSGITGGGSYAIMYGIACDSLNNLYVTGSFQRSANVYDQSGTLLVSFPVFSFNQLSFLCKFNSSGVYQYGRFVDFGGGGSVGYSISCDYLNNVYFCGYGSCLNNITPTIYNDSKTALATLPYYVREEAHACKFNSSGVYQYSFLVDSNENERSISINCDGYGNVYFAGNLTGFNDITTSKITFASSSNVFTIVGTLPARVGYQPSFVCKFNSSGVYQYSVFMDCPNFINSSYVTTDLSGNMYVSGGYSGTPTIYNISNSNVSTTVGTLPANTLTYSAFISKFNSSGVYQYSKTIDGFSGNEYVNSIVCDSSNSVYLVGRYSNAATLYDQNGIGIGSLPFYNNRTFIASGFLCKFDFSGNYNPQIQTFIRLAEATATNTITYDSKGFVYLIGSYNSLAAPRIYDQNGNLLVTLPSSQYSGLFTGSLYICKFTTSGVFQYARIIDNVRYVISTHAAVCDSNGNIYVSSWARRPSVSPTIRDQNGNVLGTLPISTNMYSFVCKFNSSGAYQYSRIVESSWYFNYSSACVTCDSSDNLYFGGGYIGPGTIKTQTGSVVGTLPESYLNTAVGPGNYLIGFMCKFNSSGVYQYSRVIDSSEAYNTALACDSLGSLYMGGVYTTRNFISYSLASPYLYNVTSSNVVSNIATLPFFLLNFTTMYCLKSNSSGTHLYARYLVASNGGITNSITCDSLNNMYFGGSYIGAASGPSMYGIKYTTGSSPTFTGEYTIPPYDTTNTETAIIMKYDSNGNYQYSKTIRPTTSGEAATMFSTVCDYSGSVYFCGYYSSGSATLNTIDTSNVYVNSLTLPTVNYPGSYVCKSDPTGKYQYTKIIDSATSFSIEYTFSLSRDNLNNIYLCGTYGSNLPPPIMYNVNSSGISTIDYSIPTSNSSSYFMKLESSGRFNP